MGVEMASTPSGPNASGAKIRLGRSGAYGAYVF